MKGRELYEFHAARGGDMEPIETRVEREVEELIAFLYKPDIELGSKLDPARCEALGVDTEEPVNWGDLFCTSVKEYLDGSFNVIVEEASPHSCPTLCEYIQTYMEARGWTVYVTTEW